jgi:FAD synthetase
MTDKGQIPPQKGFASVAAGGFVSTDRSGFVIDEALRTHGAAKLGVSFNGGKDSVVMLYRVLEVAGMSKLREMTVFNLLERNEFEEMSSFRASTAASLGLTVVNFPAGESLKDALSLLLERYPLEGIFMGTRTGDPNAKYQSSDVCPTSNGWPKCVLYCPVFSWSYGMIWDYTLKNKLPVCSLYEQGYTSIGCPRTTSPNPHLLIPDSETGSASGSPGARFRPAWNLENEIHERAGRSCASAL